MFIFSVELFVIFIFYKPMRSAFIISSSLPNFRQNMNYFLCLFCFFFLFSSFLMFMHIVNHKTARISPLHWQYVCRSLKICLGIMATKFNDNSQNLKWKKITWKICLDFFPSIDCWTQFLLFLFSIQDILIHCQA